MSSERMGKKNAHVRGARALGSGLTSCTCGYGVSLAELKSLVGTGGARVRFEKGDTFVSLRGIEDYLERRNPDGGGGAAMPAGNPRGPRPGPPGGQLGLLKLAEAAELVDVCEAKLRRDVKTGVLPAKRFGKRLIYVHIDDLMAMFHDIPTTGSLAA